MRALLLLLMVALPAWAQDKPQPAPKKKPPATKKQSATAHKKPTPDQIRKFNQLEKKQETGAKKK